MAEIKKNYVRLSAHASGRNSREIKKEMIRVRDDLGLTFKEYYTNKYYELTPTQQARRAGKIIKDRIRIQGYFDLIKSQTGKDESQVWKEIKKLNKLNLTKITSFMYTKFELYNQSYDEQVESVKLLARRKQLKLKLAEEFAKVDKGELTYEDVDPLVEEFYDIERTLMPESFKQEMADLISLSRPQILTDRDYFERISVDMEATRNLLGFTTGEYISFHFAEKTLPEKREFINENERTVLLTSINDMDKADSLDNKYLCYSRLSEYYGREMILVEGESDFDKFKDFCSRHEKFVKKPISDSLGRGIELITADQSALEDQFNKLLQENVTFIAEELIIPHEAIKALHPGSVNTIRLITYFDGEKTIIHHPFMKVGQKGSFIDNGGAGGILVAIDPESGVLISDGVDENGRIYETQPDTGITFKGYQLPNWEQAIELGKELSTKIPGFCYIGWDITCNADGRWIIVEGNSKTQFFGQQSTTDTGLKKEVTQTVSGSIRKDI